MKNTEIVALPARILVDGKIKAVGPWWKVERQIGNLILAANGEPIRIVVEFNG